MSSVSKVAGRQATAETTFDADLATIRAMSMVLPGACPVAINGVRVAASIRPRPVAPGLVLIRSPGHSPDSQMVYIRLQSGREILHSVDSAWIMGNIHGLKGKAAPWVKEDTAAVMAQLRWLHRVDEIENNVTILVTHDDELFERLTRSRVIGAQLAA